MYPNEAGWTLTNMLLATIADVLRWLQWAKTKDGQKGRGAPEPIARPGVRGRKRPVHPVGKGVPRSKLRKLLRRPEPADRAKRLATLFSRD